MCLIIPRDRESFIAKKDITVYKVLRKKGGLLFAAYVDDFYYEYNRLYTTILEETRDCMTFDDLDQREAEQFFGSSVSLLPPAVYKSIGPGFHSALTKKRLTHLVSREDNYYVIRECIIPNGSECYLGFTDLITSNQIIISSVV